MINSLYQRYLNPQKMSNKPELDLRNSLLANEQTPIDADNVSSPQSSIIELQGSFAAPSRSEVLAYINDPPKKIVATTIDDEQPDQSVLDLSYVPLKEDQNQEKQKTNGRQTFLMAMIDLLGTLAFLTYCGFMQTYLTTFYLLMMLLIFNFMWMKIPRGVGMFTDKSHTNKIIVPIPKFVKEIQNIVHQDQDGPYSQRQFSKKEYQSKYWFVFRDVNKYFWIVILVVSILSLINKITFYVMLNTIPDYTLNLMSYDNFQGLEIFFTLNSDKVTFTFTPMNYTQTFAPNIFVILMSLLAVVITRVDKKVNLETQNFVIKSKVFKFYIAMVWLQILTMICTASSVQGIILLMFQLVLTLKIFLKKKSPNSLEVVTVNLLKIYLYFMIIGMFAFQTPIGMKYQEQIKYLSSFLGLDVLSLGLNKWNSTVFVSSSFILFTFLCLLTEQMQNEERRALLHPTIVHCVDDCEKFQICLDKDQAYKDNQAFRDNYKKTDEQADSESRGSNSMRDSYTAKVDLKNKSVLQSSKSDKQQYLESSYKCIYKFTETIKVTLDNPIVTLRFVQIMAIIVIILQKTYFTLILSFWVFGTGFTLNMNFNKYSSLIFAIPSLFFNIMTQLYANINDVGAAGNEFAICKEEVLEFTDVPSSYCGKLGYYKDRYSYLNILMMDIALCAFILLLKQIQEQQESTINEKKIKAEGLHFMTKKRVRIEDISIGTIMKAFIFKISYFVSLLFLFWVGFHEVNLVQFVLVLFLLIFLINDSQQSIYTYSKPQKQLNVPPEQLTMLVPFAFKYWWTLVVYVEFMIITRYIYIFFIQDNIDTDNQTLQLIGINGNAYYDALFWILFYFVALQYDSYRSKVYLKYSNRLADCIMEKPQMKKLLPNYLKNQGIWYLMYLKCIIWVSFTVNLMVLIFTGFNFINAILLLILGSIFCYFVGSLISGVNYKRIKLLWYLYLNVLVLAFVVRYTFQFMCIPSLSFYNSHQVLQQIYDSLEFRYRDYGFYSYDSKTSNLRLEYFPDMLTIFLGAISLNTFEIFVIIYQYQKSSSQKQILVNKSKSNITDSSRKNSQSQISIADESSIDGGDRTTTNLLQRKRKQDTEEIAKMMQISLLDEYKIIKTPILIFANINTDIITILVVITAVFFSQSIAMGLIMIFYLRFYLIVHDRILNLLSVNGILRKMSTKVDYLKKKYSSLEVMQRSSLRDTDQQDIQQIVKEIKLTRLTTRVKVKIEVGRQSFYFTALCAFLTYMSLALTAKESISQDQQETLWWKYLNYFFFVFGTYASQDGETRQCFCGQSDVNPQCQIDGNSEKMTSNIFSNIWFFLLLVFVNVIDFMCTVVLIEDLKNETALYELNKKPLFTVEQDKIDLDDLTPKQSKSLDSAHSNIHVVKRTKSGSKQQKGLTSIREEEEEEKQANQTKSKLSMMKIDEQKSPNQAIFLHDFTIVNDYMQNEDRNENIDQFQQTKSEPFNKQISEGEVDQSELKYQSQKYALLIQYYQNQDTLLGITFQQAYFIILQRVFILVFLLNTLLANNLFSFYYLGIATYLFLQKPNVNFMRILNSYSVFAIFAQYVLLLLNLSPNINRLPEILASQNPIFSVVQNAGLKDELWLSYLGFSDQYNNLEWIFILNTFVLSLIYSYFLLLDVISNQILKKTIQLELGMTQTDQVIMLQLKANPSAKLSINYPSWKNRLFTSKNAVYEIVVRNCNLFLVAIILLLSQTNRVIFNLVELFMALIFYLAVELFFRWPYTKNLDSFMLRYFRILFYIPVLTIFSFTALKIPYLLIWCSDPVQNDEESRYFICQQIRNINITGMAFIMFFISLYFDLVTSQQHQESIKEYTKKTLLKARMISKCLAYDANQKKYKEILFEIYQKNIFKEIQFQIMEKLKIWHRRMKDPQTQTKEDESEEEDISLANETILEKNSEGEPSMMIENKEQQEQIQTSTSFQIFLTGTIIWLQKSNDQFKFMGISNLMDYILAQNQVLQRHIYISIEDYIKEDFSLFRIELDLIDAFYTQLYQKIALQYEISNELIERVVKEILPNNQRFSLERRIYSNTQTTVQQEINIGQTNHDQEQIMKFSEYKKSRELAYVHFVDPKINFYNTKILAQTQDFDQYSTWGLFLLFIKELTRYMISNWSVILYSIFILYFCKNSGILGGVLPAFLFLWIIIEEGEAPRSFWMFAFFLMGSIIILIFSLTQAGLFMDLEEQNVGVAVVKKQPSWHPFYNADGEGMVFETIIISMIIVQLFLQKKWGVFNQTIAQIENIFKGYIRMKINKFGQDATQELTQEQPLLQQLEKREDRLKTSQIIQPVQQASLKRSYSLGGQPDLRSGRAVSIAPNKQDIIDEQVNNYYIQDINAAPAKRTKNKFEQKIEHEPELLNTNDKFTFIERTFASKFAKPGRDLYPFVAGIQIIIFVYILFFFTGMVSGQNNINSIIKQNQIPGSLVIALLFQMILMVLERFITLRTPFVTVEQQNKDDLEDEQKQLSKKKSTNNSKSSKQKVEDEYKVQRQSGSIHNSNISYRDNTPKTQDDQTFLQTYRVQFIMKYILQIVLVVCIYIFIFIYLGKPYTQIPQQRVDATGSISSQETIYNNFESGRAVVVFFLLYSIYFYLSALQLKYGYRELKMRNTFLQNDSQSSYIYGKVFYSIPFLFELKVLMDWTFIQTSLDVYQWFKLEDIHGLIYFAKITANNYKSRSVGQRIVPAQKIGLGCTLVTFILACIFTPLILFSTLNPSSETNLVIGGEFTISLVNTAQSLNVPLYTSNQLQGLNQTFDTEGKIKDAFYYSNGTDSNVSNPTITNANDYGALQKFQLLEFSNSDWDISQPLFNLLTNSLLETINGRGTVQNDFFLNVTYVFSRNRSETTSNKNTFSFPGNNLINQYTHQIQELSIQNLQVIYDNMMNCNQDSLFLENFYIQTIQIYSTDGKSFKPRPILGGAPDIQSVSMSLNCTASNVSARSPQTQSWWEFKYEGDTKQINPIGQQGLLFFVVSDNFSSLTSGFSIITIYTTVILVIATFIRSLFSGQVFLIEFTDMLKPDDLLMICQAISIARNQKDFVKENLLYFELIDILRSPEIVKVMTGSWSETFKKKFVQQRSVAEKQKLKYD